MGSSLLRQFLLLVLHVLLVLLQFWIEGGLLLTLKSVGIARRLLEAAMLSTIIRWRRYSSSIFFLEITGGVSMMRFPNWQLSQSSCWSRTVGGSRRRRVSSWEGLSLRVGLGRRGAVRLWAEGQGLRECVLRWLILLSTSRCRRQPLFDSHSLCFCIQKIIFDRDTKGIAKSVNKRRNYAESPLQERILSSRNSMFIIFTVYCSTKVSLFADEFDHDLSVLLIVDEHLVVELGQEPPLQPRHLLCPHLQHPSEVLQNALQSLVVEDLVGHQRRHPQQPPRVRATQSLPAAQKELEEQTQRQVDEQRTGIAEERLDEREGEGEGGEARRGVAAARGAEVAALPLLLLVDQQQRDAAVHVGQVWEVQRVQHLLLDAPCPREVRHRQLLALRQRDLVDPAQHTVVRALDLDALRHELTNLLPPLRLLPPLLRQPKRAPHLP